MRAPLAVVVAYKRFDLLHKWIAAWRRANNMHAALAVVHSYDGDAPREEHAAAIKHMLRDLGTAGYYHPRRNDGMDIGALRDVVNIARTQPGHALAEWDHLYWSTDDALPMHKDFLQFFVRPFLADDGLGLVGNYLVPENYYKDIPEHVRTVSFALCRPAAIGLHFPPRLVTKRDCWEFEYGAYNMLHQIRNMGYKAEVAGSPPRSRPWFTCNDHVWDCNEIGAHVHWDKNRMQDHWERFNLFTEGAR